MLCFFATDLHGKISRYRSLLDRIRAERPAAVFLGGDLLPMPMDRSWATNPAQHDFLRDFLVHEFKALAADLAGARPRVFLILGNDDAALNEAPLVKAAGRGIWEYAHPRRISWPPHAVFGYACIPPTPFQLKDWERYDVSRHVDPGCISPEAGQRTVAVPPDEIRYGSIQKDLARLAGNEDLSQAVILFHSPPYKTKLDRAALDGKMVDHVPIDPHIGSIAIQRFIEKGQPLLSLHGHVHESTRLTGEWREKIGRTHCFQGAHDGRELALIRFDPAALAQASRELI